ncbi:response regulator transcription factor [Photobacterium aphoticum]|uniref:Transcriptional regulator n=1 Tax=Photobacterium aphoticum TaxID=754436 RepID=A0A0J1GI91_9GAMM|nr:response regulator transcription factor [Photobacterium aphoticum]KLU99285.1 hypothetical protein ABT58_18315 [Photobacterium aphoticum]PSU55309.1 DNA-binding response regulator [Photobacterium aphoticum]GHA46274.1 DNA-binding response regulator [Photobacterium aphoticum]
MSVISQVSPFTVTVLIADPSETYGQYVREQFWQAGLMIRRCVASEDILQIIEQGAVGIVILSMQLADMRDLALLKRCRAQTSVPIIVIDEDTQMAQSLNCFYHGADDYVAKQRPVKELCYRTLAILQRVYGTAAPIEQGLSLTCEQLTLDRQQQVVSFAGHSVSMTPIQFKLLWTLVSQRREILTKPYLYQQVLAREFSPYDRSLDMHLSRIRKKLVAAGMPAERLQTAHGKGYCFA